VRDLEEVFECKVDLDLNVRFTKSMHDMPLEADSVGAATRMVD
jgi:hypothetical protein